MKLATIVVFLSSFAWTVRGDTGGPYEGMPDINANEAPPIFKVPVCNEPLRFYLENAPKLKWNPEINEPETYEWVKISSYYANFRVLGHVRGRELYEVRYVSDTRIEQGLDYADIILILARGFDTTEDKNRLEVIYFATGGASFNRRAEYVDDADKYGAIKVTRWWSGTGPGRSSSVFIRGTEDFTYERFTPK